MTNQNEKPPTNHKQQQHIDRKRKNVNNNDNAKSIRINPKHEDMLDLCLWSPNHSATPSSFSSPPTTPTPSQWQLSLSPLSSQPSAHPPPQQPNPNPSPPSSPLEWAGEGEDQGRSEVQEVRVRIRNGVGFERQFLTIGGVHMGKQRRNVRARAGSLDQPDAPQVPLLPPRQQRKTRDKSQPDSHKLALLATGAAAGVLHPGSTQIAGTLRNLDSQVNRESCDERYPEEENPLYWGANDQFSSSARPISMSSVHPRAKNK
nr:hypothetical protein Iba_chr06bCG10610 [Ipomoea batatas]